MVVGSRDIDGLVNVIKQVLVDVGGRVRQRNKDGAIFVTGWVNDSGQKKRTTYVIVTDPNSSFYGSILGPDPEHQIWGGTKEAVARNVEEQITLQCNFGRYRSFQPIMEYRRLDN